MLLHARRCSIGSSVGGSGSFTWGDTYVRTNPTIIDFTARNAMMIVLRRSRCPVLRRCL